MGDENREVVGSDMCKHCGMRADAHRLGNYADGPSVGKEFLVCPNSTFAFRFPPASRQETPTP